LIGILLGGVGVSIVLISAIADYIGLGATPEYLGRYQFLSMSFGMILIVVAAVFWLMVLPGHNDS
jgi:hypothetical protein